VPGLLEGLLNSPTTYLFVTGKGGVGKTSLSAAVAVALADRGRRVLLVSTDPASNLSEVLGTPLSGEARAVTGVANLWALDIDPLQAAAAYRDRVVGPYRGVLPDTVVRTIEEQLSGACTVEIAAFDEFTGLLVDRGDYDHVVFDTAPTGHTLRLLALPGAWTSYLDTNNAGVTCVGPLSGLTNQRARYKQALAALADPDLCTVVLVTRPDDGAVAEADRASRELALAGLTHQRLIVNGVLASTGDDELARRFTARQRRVLTGLPASLRSLVTEYVPLRSSTPLGVAHLRSLLADQRGGDEETPEASDVVTVEGSSLDEFIDTLARRGRGLVMTVGKGGVGKTTLAAAIGVALADRGYPVVLSTTDPAAHLREVLGDGLLPDNLWVERIDPVSATIAYRDAVMARTGATLDDEGRDLLIEDLRSPCTEEIAVFQEFAATVARASEGFVVLDTAPSGHTLLLLDAAQGYQREVARQSGGTDEHVANLLARLSDPEQTSLVVVTLPEATPFHEAQALQDDVVRAGVTPAAWVVNQSLGLAGSTDAVLRARAAHETPWIEAARVASPGPLVVVEWLAEAPVGVTALRALGDPRRHDTARVRERV
jgi:arsenite-transporting ATPase